MRAIRSQYLPLEQVLRGTMETYAAMLGVTFERDTDAQQSAWHPDVHCYVARDAVSSTFLARFYFDLHPRQGKYTHAACFWLTKRGPGGQTPTACVVCNFTAPTADRPALLQFSEAETFFVSGHICCRCHCANCAAAMAARVWALDARDAEQG